jgi:hypothetical protein
VVSAPVKPPLIPTAVALKEIDPLFDGFQVQDIEKLVPEPVAVKFLQPGITFPFEKNVTLED